MIKNELKTIKNESVRQSYFFHVHTTIPHGSSDLEKFMNLAMEVFPELKEEELKAKRKQQDWNPLDNKIQVKEHTFDVGIKTTEGLFLVKYFDEPARHEQIKKILDDVHEFSKRKHIFRLIFLAKEYDFLQGNDDSVTNKMLELTSSDVYNDGILLKDNSFSIIWLR